VGRVSPFFVLVDAAVFSYGTANLSVRQNYSEAFVLDISVVMLLCRIVCLG